ncbi:PIN domain-containing protein [bacterium]|nr:PIN domain-containing protein [bacterium]
MAGGDLRPSSEFLLDTGIIIRYLRKNRRAADLLDYLEELGEISVPAITYMEILIKCQPDEEEATLLFFDRVPPLTISPEVARKAATLIKKYPENFGKNNPRGFLDALIAATAWEQGSTLITLNTRQFANVIMTELSVRAIDQNARDWVAIFKN